MLKSGLNLLWSFRPRSQKRFFLLQLFCEMAEKTKVWHIEQKNGRKVQVIPFGGYKVLKENNTFS